MCSACLVFLTSFECHWSVDVQMQFICMFISDHYSHRVIGGCCLSNDLRVTITEQVQPLYYRRESQLGCWNRNNVELSPAHNCCL